MVVNIYEFCRFPERYLELVINGSKVKLSRQSEPIAELVPLSTQSTAIDAGTDSAFGMWSERDDIADVTAFVRALRGGNL